MGNTTVNGAGIVVVAVGLWPTNTIPLETCIVDLTRVSVITRGGVVRINTSVNRVTGFIRTRVVVIAVQRGAGNTGAVCATVADGARIAVVARSQIWRIAASCGRITAIVGARVVVVAIKCRRARAGRVDTHITHRTHVVVVTWGGVGRIDAARCGVACVIGTWIVVLTIYRSAANTQTVGAGVGCGAGVAVVARIQIGCVDTPTLWVAGIVGARVSIVTIEGRSSGA